MENALWNGHLLIASELADDYTLEKEIRKASGRKELRCPDPLCQHPVLRYCHGEIKDAFFAHLNNEHCDYANFDKDNTQVMRTIRRVIYEHFKNKGYQVRLEVKLLDHQYTHLLFDMADGSRVAVEIGTQRLTANRIDSLTDAYRKKNIAVKWIVLGNPNTPVREKQTFFIKRYLLNESTNKDLLVVNHDGSEVAQYKADPNKYEYNGRNFSSVEYPDTYMEYATLSDLTFEENELSFAGFHERYQKWLVKKQAAFNEKVRLLEEERKRMEEIQRQAQEKNRLFWEEQQERIRRSKLNQSPTTPPRHIADAPIRQTSSSVVTQAYYSTRFPGKAMDQMRNLWSC
ncbi:MAG: competence protein CoiA family protein [Thermincola sp.]|jgi:hypothetical protein|nr:competence protein CoiA family protein [Thermincola sp.]MDT3704742.1 competence protein CoiA family protein [Thermincola sp.]